MATGAPLPDDFGKRLGKSMGVGEQGIQPEVSRNRQKPDRGNKSGQPWPKDQTAPETDRVVESGTVTGMTSGVFESAAITELPGPGVWLVAARVTFTLASSPAGPASWSILVNAGEDGHLAPGVGGALPGGTVRVGDNYTTTIDTATAPLGTALNVGFIFSSPDVSSGDAVYDVEATWLRPST